MGAAAAGGTPGTTAPAGSPPRAVPAAPAPASTIDTLPVDPEGLFKDVEPTFPAPAEPVIPTRPYSAGRAAPAEPEPADADIEAKAKAKAKANEKAKLKGKGYAERLIDKALERVP